MENYRDIMIKQFIKVSIIILCIFIGTLAKEKDIKIHKHSKPIRIVFTILKAPIYPIGKFMYYIIKGY
jgi:hypothetical protein